MSIQTLGKNTYVDISYTGANLGCVDTEKGLVLIDTPFIQSEIKKWQEDINVRFDKPIYCVINTHHHFDHVLGNKEYSNYIIGHNLVREEMSKTDGTMCNFFVSRRKDLSNEEKELISNVPIIPPTITFCNNMWLSVGEVTIELFEAKGHTASSIFIHVKEDNVLFAGDNFVSNCHPYMGQANIDEWTNTLSELMETDIENIIPGHGEPGDNEAIFKLRYFLNELRDEVKNNVENNICKEETVEKVHNLVNYFPLNSGEEEIQIMLFDETVRTLYDNFSSNQFLI